MILVIAVGQKQPAWVEAVFNDYATRFPSDHRISLKEVKAEPRTTGKSIDAMKAAESERITAAIPKDAICVALDERGQDMTTQAFSDWLIRLKEDSRHIVFIIGGPDGLDDDLKRRCTKMIRLSSMTLPHGMARVLLAEQLYRAWSLATNHPYHRA